MKRPRIDSLESTTAIALACLLVAGTAFAGQPSTTVILHGYSAGDKGAWVQGMAQAVIARAGQGSVYRYTGSTGAWTFVAGDGTANTLALIFNWVPESAGVSAGPNWNYAQAAGDVLQSMLRDAKYIGGSGPADLIAGRTVHLLGHSRGACVISEAARRLGAAGISIDQLTMFDPHPVNGTLDPPFDYEWGDPVPQAWSNVAFTDNYWRADGSGIINSFDFDGIPIAGAFNTQLSESALNCCAYSFSHSDTHLWHHGTIDLSPAPCDGEQCINATMRSTWWPEGFTQRGYYYSVIGGGSTARPALPPGVTPTVGSWIANGDFDLATHAGWSYHGGSLTSSAIALEAGNGFVRLGPVGAMGAQATHNRFFLPAEADAVEVDQRIITANPGQSLELVINIVGESSHSLGVLPLDAATGWLTGVEWPIPASVPRGRLITLTARLNGSGAAQAGLDNFDIILGQPPAPCPADIAPSASPDGIVNVDDLLAIINAWGPCADPNSCPADIAPPGPPMGDDVVNVDDLLAVINGWGACP